MMLTIHGLPPTTKYYDLKVLIKQQCNISDFILDNLLGEPDGTKKVRIGMTDEREGAYLIKCLDGYRMSGHLLRVLPVGKPMQTATPNQANFDTQGSYQARNNYQSQSGPGYGNKPVEPMTARMDPWRSNDNQWGPGHHAPNQTHPPQNNFNYQQPAQGINPGFNQQQQPLPQRPNLRAFEQREELPSARAAPQDQGYGFPSKNNVPQPTSARRTDARSHVLRSVEIVDEPLGRPLAEPARYPAHGYSVQQKPVTIMKDNFQGPQYNLDRQMTSGHFQDGPSHLNQSHQGHRQPGQSQDHPSPWTQPIQSEKQQHFSKPSATPYDKHYVDRKYGEPDKRQVLAKNAIESTRNIHDGYNKDYKETGPRFSPRRDVPITPHGRRDSPGRRISPSGRRMPSPGRRMPSPGRRMPSPGRRISPSARRVSPSMRRISPSGRGMPGRRESPPRRPGSPAGNKRLSPRRPVSPGRRESPSRPAAMRFSPTRRHDKPERYGPAEASRVGRDVRPAYDAPAQAPNQAMYAGGFRPNIHEAGQYPAPGVRPEQPRSSPWQQDRDKTMFTAMSTKDEDRRDVLRMPKFEARIEHQRGENPILEAKKHTMVRNSRSPVRRDRSPLQNRYKKHSPSPRSPRRSWALEKRRSPEIGEAPPPPIWPGRQNFLARNDDDKNKRMPIWDRTPFDEKNERSERRPEIDERRFPNKSAIRVRTDLGLSMGQPSPPGPRNLSPRSHGFKPEERFPQRDPKFEGREDFADRRGNDFRRVDNVPERKPYDRPEYRDIQRSGDREDRLQTDPMQSRHAEKREEFPRREERQEVTKGQLPFEKGFEDIYKRAVEFSKKSQAMLRVDDRRPDEYPEDRSRREMNRDGSKDYDRQKFPREEEPRLRDMRDESLGFRHPDATIRRNNEMSRRHDEPPRHHDEPPRRHDEPARRLGEPPRHLDEPLRRNDETPRHHDEPPRRREEFGKREPDWKIEAEMKSKKDKAVEEIAQKIMHKYGNNFNSDMTKRVLEEVKMTLARIFHEMFGNQDLSFIEMVVKFNANYSTKDESKIFDDVMSRFPSHYRSMKRPAEEPVRPSEVPVKSARRSPDVHLNRDNTFKGMNKPQLPEWDINIPPPGVPIIMQQFEMLPPMVPPMMIQPSLMVPAPSFAPPYDEPRAQDAPPTRYEDFSQDDGYNLYLCKDDFEPYSNNQAELLKRFLVSQLVAVSETGQGWSPDFTVKGLQSMYRYELQTRDNNTRDWIINLDFSEFKLFNVLVYTKEELWYERAAIWLPGHSKCRHIEPLDKLKLQNRSLEGVNIGKWKFVKKIVTAKGTRVYVDMPPSSARALEKEKMMLSYELQKVNVYLKAVAVDKDAFDAGLRELSIKDQGEIIMAAKTSPMPSLGHDSNIVKIVLKGNKTLTVFQARKIKEMVIYHIFKHHQENGSAKTDFVKYGICAPNCFGILPENTESKRWLTGQDFGKLHRHSVVVLGADENTTKYIKMTILLKNEHNLNTAIAFERLRQSNQGVKGLNFNLWRPLRIVSERFKSKFEIEFDLESVETIMKMNYKLDYVNERHVQHTVEVKYSKSDSMLEELIARYKQELTDTYDVANMELASSDEDDEIVYMGEVLH